MYSSGASRWRSCTTELIWTSNHSRNIWKVRFFGQHASSVTYPPSVASTSRPRTTPHSRRNQTVEVPLLTRAHDGPIYLVVDSTGLKILGPGEWNEHKHKALGKRRDWRKLHIEVDDEGWDSGPIRAGVESCNNVTRMINGRCDMLLPLEESIRPMFDLLGTPPPEHKELLLFDTDHIPPRNEFIKGTLYWLDRYLGPAM